MTYKNVWEITDPTHFYPLSEDVMMPLFDTIKISISIELRKEIIFSSPIPS